MDSAKYTTSFWIKVIIGLILVIGIALLRPPEGLGTASMRCLAILAGVIYFISVNLLDEYVAGMCGLVLVSVLGVTDFKTTFSGFSNSTWILLLGAFGMGGILSSTGVLNRIGKAVIGRFPDTFRGRVTALYLAGMILSPTMPSGSAKGIIMSLLSTAIGKEMGYKPKSRAATGLFIAGWVPVGVLGIIFLSGAVSGPLLAGLSPKEYLGEFTWTKWFLNSMVFGIVMLVGCYLANLFLYKPGPDDVDEAIKELATRGDIIEGPMNPKQKISILVLIAVLLMWIFGQQLHLDNGVIALAGFVVLLIVVNAGKKAINTMLPWGTMIFCGFVLSMSSIISAVNIDKWIAKVVGPYLIPIMNHTGLFLALLCIVIYIVRMVVISQTLTTSMFFLLLLPVALKAGINPWIVGFACAVPICTWNVLPQSIPFLCAYGAADGGDYPSFPRAVKMSVFVMIWTIVSLWACIPVWRLMGML
ncbi:MAG: SLC13 family permease [Syntrophomonadaceae bacterium]